MTITPARPTTSTEVDSPPIVFPDTVAFRGFFAPVRIEADVYDLEVEGSIRKDLNGSFYRVAADAQYPPSHENDIYINGDGMVTVVRFEKGHADLRTRFVRTQRFEQERAARRSLFGAYRNVFTDDPRVAGIDDGNANTALVWHVGKLLALKEAARPYELDPVTLETRGIDDFNGQLKSRTFTAHPKVDPVTGQLIAFAYNSSGRPDEDVLLFDIAPTGEITREQRFRAPYSSMMPDWLVTREHVIFTFSPMISDWERMKDEPQYFMWDPPKGTYVAVIPREEGVDGIRWFSSPTVMETHSLNAYSEGDIVTADFFPNTIMNVFAGHFIAARMRPDVADPERCFFDLFIFNWLTEEEEASKEKREHEFLEEGAKVGRVPDQDFTALPKVQLGLHSDGLENLFLATQGQEVRVSDFHVVLDEYLYGDSQ